MEGKKCGIKEKEIRNEGLRNAGNDTVTISFDFILSDITQEPFVRVLYTSILLISEVSSS